MESLEILSAIAQSIYDKKGTNILSLDVQAISTMADYVVIANGSIERHVQALSYAVVDRLTELKMTPLHTEGQRVGDWIVIDYGWIVVHLFTSDCRDKYDLETLWRDALVVDVKINVKAIGEV